MIAQFALVHDLVETYAGDTSNFADESEKQTKEAREHAALEKLAENFPSFPWISQTITKYEHQKSAEARFVKAVDKILLLLFDIVDQGRFFKDRQITIEEWKRVMQKHREKASTHAGVFAYYDELWNLLLANPQFFYGYDSDVL